MFEFNLEEAKWFCEPKSYLITRNSVEITTDPYSDFWQRTYYGFRHDNAHVLYTTTDERYFSFTVKTQFNSGTQFDQCGVAIYQNSDNWVKTNIEYIDENKSLLGSVVTNNGYSDWATSEIKSAVNTMWYRLSRRESDYCIESSLDGKEFKQMRIFHLFEGGAAIKLGLLACSPGNGSFKSMFTNMQVTQCMWEEHGS